MLTEKEKGSLLANRLQVLNNFLLSEENSLVDYLRKQRISKNDFITGLPESLIDLPANREDIMDYTKAMNAMYFNLYLSHAEKTKSADGEEFHEAIGSCGLPPIPPIRKRSKVPDKWKKYDEKKAAYDKCRAEKKEDKKDGKEKKGRHNLNKFNPVFVALRSAFLSLLKLNISSLASVLNHMRNQNGSSWKKLQVKWYNMGGDKEKLNDSISSGRTKKPFPKFKKRKGNADGEEEELNAEDPKQAGLVALKAAGSLGGLAALLATNPVTAPAVPYVAAGGGMLAVVSPLLKEFARSKGEDTSKIADMPLPEGTDPDVKSEVEEPVTAGPGGSSEPDIDETFWDKYKQPIIFSMAGVLILTTAITLFVLNSKQAS